MATERLILEIEVPDYNVEGLQQEADDLCDGDVGIVLEELFRPEVVLGLHGRDRGGEDPHAAVGVIVAARIKRED
jgi:hypothetical protein